MAHAECGALRWISITDDFSTRYLRASCDKPKGHKGYHSIRLGSHNASDAFGWPQKERESEHMNSTVSGDPRDSLGPFSTSGTYVSPHGSFVPQGCPYCEPRCPCCGRRLHGAPPYYPWRPYITWSNDWRNGNLTTTCCGDTNG